jgi:hypothetical protein
MHDNPTDQGNLNHLADEALYAAKQTGRNRVVSWAAMTADEDQTEMMVAENPQESEAGSSVAGIRGRVERREPAAPHC